jgi:DNA polymerase III epsilon subunit-like protein
MSVRLTPNPPIDFACDGRLVLLAVCKTAGPCGYCRFESYHMHQVLRRKVETYVSVDVETNGSIPALHSMLSLGAVAYNADGVQLSTFYEKLEPLKGAKEDPDTMKWWSKQDPRIYEEARSNAQPPQEVMKRFSVWLDSLPARPVLIGYPVAYDYSFVRWYLVFFTGRCSFGVGAIDIKTIIALALKQEYYSIDRNKLPKEWLDENLENTHNALDDALYQGSMFFKILKSLRVDLASQLS